MWDRKSRYEKKLSPGEVLFRENDLGEEMYLIGQVKIAANPWRKIGILP